MRAQITCKCIRVHIGTCVRQWMLGVRVCVQDAWESLFAYFEVTMIRFDSHTLRLLGNALEYISVSRRIVGCVCVRPGRMESEYAHSKCSHLYVMYVHD